MKHLLLPLTRGGVLTALTLLCCANAYASVRMYVIWQPVQDSPTWQRAEGDPITRPGIWSSWAWDGRLSDGSVAERGLYFYRVSASTRCGFVTDGDNNRSDFLHIEHARDQSGKPILEAEYWGYDDKGTPENENDDEHLFFVRWYVLKDTRNASSGEIWLFDPELQRIGSWDLSQLPCVEHNNQPDGLTATPAGTQHGVLVRVSVNMMGEMGEYLLSG